MSRDDDGIDLRYVIAGLLCTLCVYLAFVSAVRLEDSVSRFGYIADPDGTRQFLRELDKPNFQQAGAEAIAKATGVDTFLYRAVYKAHLARYGTPFVVGSQGIGDCVSWGWSAGIYFSQCQDWDTGRISEPPLMPATESIYGGSRVEARNKPEGGGGWSDGSYGGAAARWVRDWGVVYRQPIGDHDLTIYSADRAKQFGYWGNGGKGDNARGAQSLDFICKAHPTKHVALVTDWESCCAAIESGFSVPVCSKVGFGSVRDADGFLERRGSWGHCMCLIATRHADGPGKRDGILCINSWGPSWVSGPKWPLDQPEGSFWISKATISAMLSGEDSFAVGSVSGFGFRDLSHGDFLEPAPLPNSETYQK